MVIGLALVAVGVWALLAYLPGNKPMPDNPEIQQLTDEMYYAGNVSAVALLLVGFVIAAAGAVFRAQTEVLCRICNHQVIGWKSTFGLLCPIEKHYARVHWFGVIVAALFWLMALGFLGVIVILPYA